MWHTWNKGSSPLLLTSSRKRKCEWTDSRAVFHFHQHGSEYRSQQCYALKPQASVKTPCLFFERNVKDYQLVNSKLLGNSVSAIQNTDIFCETKQDI